MNVWISLLIADHVHRSAALHWWDHEETDVISFCRVTQIGVLRLLTTSAAMNGRPLTSAAAWKAYDRLYSDPRVQFMAEPPSLDDRLRKLSTTPSASPKLWVDAYLAAFAARAGAVLVTFDRALAARAEEAQLLE